MLADVIILIYEVPYIFWHYINVESLSKNYYKVRWTVITNCDSFFITKCDKVYYKLRQVLQRAMDLLQIATGITKCDDYYKLRQYKGMFASSSCKLQRPRIKV